MSLRSSSVAGALLALMAPVLLAGCPAGSAEDGNSGESESSTGESTTDTSTSAATETGTETETGTDTEGDPPRPARLLMTSDWRAKRLSLLDYTALRDGAQTREEALWKTIELDAWEPGPLEAELSPDGSTAVVAVGPGFFASAIGGLVGAGQGTIPAGGAVLIVDLDTGSVLAEIDTASYPMGIVISDDGSSAWTANFGGNGQSGSTISHIDLVSHTIVEEIEVGPGPEQLDLLGSRAIVNTAGDGSIRLFDTGDPLATLSPSLVTSSDSSWVLHLAGGTRAAVINSLGPPGYSLVDTSDPQSPMVLETVEVTGIPYAATRGRDDSEIVMTVLAGTTLELHLYDTDTAELLVQIEAEVIGLPLGLAFDPDDELALVPVPGSDVLVIADIAAGDYRTVPWQDEPGPTYVALEP
jgi:DNA-binding beta-propeller fold protein YncE